MSNLEIQAGTETSGSNFELHVKPETSRMSDTVIDPTLNVGDDSDRDPHCHPNDDLIY